MKNILSLFWKSIFTAIVFCAPAVSAQTGGPYQITQSVVASGERSAGGSFSIESTGGQALAGGFLQNSSYALYSGFWTPPGLAPTAAYVNLSGHVTTLSGQGIRNALITLTGSNGVIRTTQTVTFGYFLFADVRAGESYLLTISSKRYIFSNPTRILSVADDLSDLNFIAEN
jgi:hypothetical protein